MPAPNDASGSGHESKVINRLFRRDAVPLGHGIWAVSESGPICFGRVARPTIADRTCGWDDWTKPRQRSARKTAMNACSSRWCVAATKKRTFGLTRMARDREPALRAVGGYLQAACRLFFCRKPPMRQRCKYAELPGRAPPWAVLIWNRAHLANDALFH
jgi:hypothetical protein